MKKNILVFICFSLVFSSLLFGCGSKNLKNAIFTNLEPSITIDNEEYIISNNTVNKDGVGEQIAKVTSINKVISYSDENDPYKKIGKIYKIKNESQDKIIAIEINDTLYLAEINEFGKKQAILK